MLLGGDPPKNIMPPLDSNEAGHWEPMRLIELHDALLSSAGTYWHDPAPFPSSWYDSADAAEFRSAAVQLLADEYGDSSLFVLKDPRICRTVPFWCSALEEFGATPHFVIPIRNPIEVVGSLAKRDGFSTSLGMLIWLRNVLDAEQATRNHPRAFVRYGAVLRDWEAVAQQLARQLRIRWPRPIAEARPDVDAFLSENLRHHEATTAELEESTDISDNVKLAFITLDKAVTSSRRPSAPALDRIHAVLDDADRIFGPLLASSEIEIHG
jgi:hypothetical protein